MWIMIPHSDAFYRTPKNKTKTKTKKQKTKKQPNCLKYHKHNFSHSPRPYPSLFFANWSRIVKFSRHLPENEVQFVYTDEHWKSCCPPKRPAWRPKSLRTFHPVAKLTCRIPTRFSEQLCAKDQLLHSFSRAPWKGPHFSFHHLFFFFFNKKEFQVIPYIPFLKTPLRHIHHVSKKSNGFCYLE